MAHTTTINGIDYKTRWNGDIQITTDHHISYEKVARKHRGTQINAGWAVYHGDNDIPKSQHGEDRDAAVEAAQAAQVGSDERAADRAAKKAKQDAADAKRDALIAEKGTLATPRQVEYILTLIQRGRHEEGGFYEGPTTREGVESLSKSQASAYISSLTGNY